MKSLLGTAEDSPGCLEVRGAPQSVVLGENLQCLSLFLAYGGCSETLWQRSDLLF